MAKKKKNQYSAIKYVHDSSVQWFVFMVWKTLSNTKKILVYPQLEVNLYTKESPMSKKIYNCHDLNLPWILESKQSTVTILVTGAACIM